MGQLTYISILGRILYCAELPVRIFNPITPLVFILHQREKVGYLVAYMGFKYYFLINFKNIFENIKDVQLK